MTRSETKLLATNALRLILSKLDQLKGYLGYRREPAPTLIAPRGPRRTLFMPMPPPDVPLLERLRGMQRDFENATVRLGIIGEAGAGKSSLINAIVGREVAQVGALIETTQAPQEVPVHGLVLVDLPGCGTTTWPRDHYIERLKLLDSYDGFILVTANRLKECDVHLYEELARKANKPFFVVRSHFDQAAAARGEAEARRVIAPHIREQLHAAENLPVYMVSSVGKRHYDLETLILDIRAALPGWKQVQFIMAAHAYGAETLQLKRGATERIVGVYAGLAAANALNPIPGLDVSVDLGILGVMARYVIGTYGFAPDQVKAIENNAQIRAGVLKGLQEVAERFAPYLTQRFILIALERMGMEALVKNSSKWVPFVGTMVSAGLGYKLTYHFGEQLIDDCESAARQMIEAATADPDRAAPMAGR
jgi:predicted GTPase